MYVSLVFQILHIVGVITSPNHPRSYDNNINKTDMVIAEEGLILSLEFNAFDVHEYTPVLDPCPRDHLTIVDGDGTILLQKTCGTTLPTSIRSRSNLINIIFFADSSDAATGWNISWSAVEPGDLLPFLLL